MTPLEDALDVDRFGGKASQLAAAIRAALPVPDGFALEVRAVEAIAAGASLSLPAGRWAVRSSAIGEDSGAASFAGMHETRLNVPSGGVADAVRGVWASARTEAALAYRAKLGVSGSPRMAVVVQRQIDPEVAGVLFTVDPTSGARLRVIEAAWGLGEAVVAGLVTPDAFRVTPAGAIVERRAGYKDMAVRFDEGGGTREVELAPHLHEALCLDDERLARLHELASRVERAFEGEHDLEWAFDAAGLHLLQRRAVTARVGRPAS